MRKKTKTWNDIPGWFCEGDAAFVSSICSRISGGVVVEIGSFAGRSTAVMAPICATNGTEFHAVDSWCIPVPPLGAALKGRRWCWRGGLADALREAARTHRASNMRHAFRRNMKSLGIWHMIRPHQADSAEAAALFADNSVNFCFIDADHRYAAVVADITAWWPKVRPGGVIGGHDWHIPGVRRAVYDALGSLAENPRIYSAKRVKKHTCWSMVKPNET